MYPTAAAAKSALSPDSPEAPALAIAARAAAARALQLDRANGEAYFAIGISYGLNGPGPCAKRISFARKR